MAQYIWKRRPSEIRGYQRALYTTTDSGDYVRVDYNLKEKQVRLYVEIAEEGGASYYSVIQNGRIAAERSVQSGRAGNFAEKFFAFSDVFSSLQNRELLDAINGRYNITKVAANGSPRGGGLEETRARYFRRDEVSPYASDNQKEPVYFLRNFGWLDALDVIVTVLLAVGIFLVSSYKLAWSGALVAVAGLVTGLLDMVVRDRDPVFIKVLFLFLSGAMIYGYGYYIF